MKNKVLKFLTVGLIMVVLAGCGAKEEPVNGSMAEESTKEESISTGEDGAETSVETATDAPVKEDITDGNIVLYGNADQNPVEYIMEESELTEEINVVIENAEAQIPLYSKGRLCGHLNEGGSITITEHCLEGTAWYRFKNPIPDTEYEYLYVFRYDTVTTKDEIEYIKKDISVFVNPTFLDEKAPDMECYEFSIERKQYGSQLGMFDPELFDAKDYKTYYIECDRNGDYFDCRVYYSGSTAVRAENNPVVNEPVENTPSVEASGEQSPVADNSSESDKYTPEEAIAVYRSILEEAGITWDPSIKEFASWGTGFLYLDKGYAEEAGETSVESYQAGDGGGRSWVNYYIEVTGSDDECVYYTEWACN